MTGMPCTMPLFSLQAARELVGDATEHFARDHAVCLAGNGVDELSKALVLLAHFTETRDFERELLIFLEQLVVGGLELDLADEVALAFAEQRDGKRGDVHHGRGEADHRAAEVVE